MSNAHDNPTPSNNPTLTKRGVERRAAILQAANTLFLEKGFRAVSLDDIVTCSGGSKAAIYQYFGNKNGLFASLCEYRCENFFREQPIPEYIPGQSLYQAMLSIVTAIYQAFCHPENIAFMRLVMAEAQQDPELAQVVYDSGPKRGLDCVAEMLTLAHQIGEINCPCPYESATLFFGMLRHVQWRLLMGLPPLEEDLDANTYFPYLIERFLAGHALSS